MAAAGGPAASTMRVYFLRHGQATHNPKAEKMREAGCSFEDFLAQMQVRIVRIAGVIHEHCH